MAQAFSITGGTEIIQVADAVAREKNLNRESVMTALESAVASVARKKYGHELNIRAAINQKDGSIKIFRDLKVVEKAEDHNQEIDKKFAVKKNPAVEIGETISEELPPIDFGRVAGLTFKQVLMSKIREAEREREYEDFKDRTGEIASGVVERVENNNDILINFGRTETVLKRDQIIPRESYRKGDRIRAYIIDVRRERKGPQIFLSRTCNDFLAALFAQEVPEIYDGVVKIKAVARDAGSRAKIAVYSDDSSIDAVGSCIGPRGSRVTAVYNELQGEKIDIIEWSNDLATLAVNAIGSKTRDSMVEVQKIVIDEDSHKIIAVVPDDQLSLAIGRRGQNVKLASQLIGWNIDIISETQDATRSVDDFNRLSTMFAENLNVDEVIGQLLASEGFTNMEEVAYVEKSELLKIEGFEDSLVEELQKRAEEWLGNNKEAIEAKKAKAQAAFVKKDRTGESKEITALPNITGEIAGLLIKQGVRTLEDVADLASDELIEIVGDDEFTKEAANETIMTARERAGWI